MGQNQAAAIVRIADLSALIAEVDIAEGELKNVQMGQEAEVTTESQRTRTYRGVVREIAEQADRARGTVLVKVDILPDLPSTDPADGSAGSGSGSAEGSGSAGSATPPAPEAKKEVPVEPKKDAKTAKNKKKQTPKEIKAEKAAEAAKAAEEAKAAKAAKDAEAKEAAAKVPPTSLRPGMAVQVRFIAREQP